MICRYTVGVVVVLGLLGQAARGVILNNPDGDPPENKVAPTGPLAQSGWQYQGTWGGFLGTAVAPNFFLTAKHVGGSVGGKFTLNGARYTTVKKFDSPNSDLTLWQIEGTLPAYAPLYTASDEPGKALVVFGRGTERGSPYKVAQSIPPGSDLRGWSWGPGKGVLRWGTNTVTRIAEGPAGIGPMIAAAFDAAGGKNEAHLSGGDSGGAVFLRDGSTWKLAGINYSVDNFKATRDGAPFNAALLDRGGLYWQTEVSPDWTLTPDQAADVPSLFYATRISAHVDWIRRVTGLP